MNFEPYITYDEYTELGGKASLGAFSIYERKSQRLLDYIKTDYVHVMMDGNIIEETNTVYYYGEYEIEEQTLELYNHNTGNILELTLYNNSKPNKIDI